MAPTTFVPAADYRYRRILGAYAAGFLSLTAIYSVMKIKWLLENAPQVKTAVAEERCLFGTVDSWLLWVRNLLPPFFFSPLFFFLFIQLM